MSISDGTIFQRGPNGQVPAGQSINGVPGAPGSIPLNGQGSEHVTMFGEGWHRSWDNPGTTGDHFTNHATGQITQAPKP
jgi:hypothetical protein